MAETQAIDGTRTEHTSTQPLTIPDITSRPPNTTNPFRSTRPLYITHHTIFTKETSIYDLNPNFWSLQKANPLPSPSELIKQLHTVAHSLPQSPPEDKSKAQPFYILTRPNRHRTSVLSTHVPYNGSPDPSREVARFTIPYPSHWPIPIQFLGYDESSPREDVSIAPRHWWLRDHYFWHAKYLYVWHFPNAFSNTTLTLVKRVGTKAVVVAQYEGTKRWGLGLGAGGLLLIDQEKTVAGAKGAEEVVIVSSLCALLGRIMRGMVPVGKSGRETGAVVGLGSGGMGMDSVFEFGEMGDSGLFDGFGAAIDGMDVSV